jgi:hypothetical protein
MRFRLSELGNVCQNSRHRFEAGDPPASGDGRLVNFHFAAFSSLVQTIKDILPVVSGQELTWSGISDVRHMRFMHAVRNAITHDGNPVVNLWADGRFYIACDFVRLDSRGKPVEFKAPAEDIETLAVQFTDDLCSYLRSVLSPLRGNQALSGPLYGAEFFDNAINHPAVPVFAKNLYAGADRSAVEQSRADPVTELLSELSALASYCDAQGHAAQQTVEAGASLGPAT